MRFLTMVASEYERHGAIVEKYDVVRARANLGHEILFGYRTNEAGFGWTNAVYAALFDELPLSEQAARHGRQITRKIGLAPRFFDDTRQVRAEC